MLIALFPFLQSVSLDELPAANGDSRQSRHIFHFSIDYVVDVRQRAPELQSDLSDGKDFSKNCHGDLCLHEWPTSTRELNFSPCRTRRSNCALYSYRGF